MDQKNDLLHIEFLEECWVNNHAHVLKPKVGLDIDYLCYSLMFYKVEWINKWCYKEKINTGRYA